MNPESIIAGASAALSVVASVYSAQARNKAARLQQQLETETKERDATMLAERVLHQYRQPLLEAAHALQGRLFNIMALDFLGRYYVRESDEEERAYARDYTVYVIAEYLCWAEILRREARFDDLQRVPGHRDLMERLSSILYAFQDDRHPTAHFRVFRGRQRALAELMMVPTGAPDGPRTECMGYAAFAQRLADPMFAAWFARLRSDVDGVARSSTEDNARLVRLQGELIALMDLLDPDRVRVPPNVRRRLTEAAADPVRL
jgi:hypothetical protein